MSETSDFLARLLRTGNRAYAAYASTQLCEVHPEAKRGSGPDPFAVWQRWLASRVEELAAAVAVDEPTLFVSQVHWAKAVLAARGISTEYLRTSLKELRAVLAEELPEQVRSLAAEYLDAAIEAFDRQPDHAQPRLLPDTPHKRLASMYLLSLLEGDRRRASQLILDALYANGGVRDMYRHVLLPAQQELGRMWLTGEINVAEEHFASHTTKMVMAQLLAKATCEPPNGKTLLAAAVADNQHDIGLYAVADFFELAGWRTIQLGADVPVNDLVQATDCFNVDVLALSAALHVQIEVTKAAIEAVRKGPKGNTIKILVGGLAFANSTHLSEGIGADAYATGPDHAVRLGAQLVGLPQAEGET